jgi:hypothetical protein
MVTLRSESRFVAKIEIDIARIIAQIVVRFLVDLYYLSRNLCCDVNFVCLFC